MPWPAFDPPLGPCALAWSDGGLTALFLPGGHDRLPPAATTAAPPPWINALITHVRHGICAHRARRNPTVKSGRTAT